PNDASAPVSQDGSTHSISRHSPGFSSESWKSIDLHDLFELDDDGFRQRFRKTPMWRTRRRGLLRNAAIVLGNQSNPESASALKKGLDDPEPIVRGACAWALGQLPVDTVAALDQRLTEETDADVKRELQAAIISNEHSTDSRPIIRPQN
ncbi:MAG: HEAT repeat domain-containing protein, partial [Planctomycetota bacterium]